ncbi:MAG: hypothetical protein IPK16_23625 [Anaerolineales bacterium]|nr:hypothetical protein [Anaerolineales bacterium]
MFIPLWLLLADRWISPPHLRTHKEASPFPQRIFHAIIRHQLGAGGSAILTSNGADPAGNGWLRLTSNATYLAGYAYYNQPVPTGRGLVITFDYGSWGGTGADGLSFFLFDGATPTFNVGANGGSLRAENGYQRA